MPLLSKVKDIFKSGSSAKKKKVYHNVKLDCPEEFWDVIGELGDGAYGKVYKAQHKDTGELAALKQVNLEAEDDLETFMVEIDILCECKHPNIVELLEAYHYDGKLWMYLEYCDGGAVDSIMVDLDRPLTEPQIALLGQALCNALCYIHSNKVIHRDLKAGNVLLTMEGGIKLADFGVSAKNKNTLDKRGTFIGTPYWLAPEVILCETFIDAKYDYKADIWSLGISLIEFAQMDPPNHEVSPVRVMLKIQKSDPPKLDYPSRWSKDFNDFIAKCLTKDPALRPTADELLKHPFLNKKLDKKPIVDLLLEYKADVVEEDVDDDSEDQDPCRLSTASEAFTSSSKFDTESLHSLEKESTLHTNDEEGKNSSPVLEDRELKAGIPSEKRISKGPAPLPPVVSTSNQPSPKKGPAPAVPSISPITTSTTLVTTSTTTTSVIAVSSVTTVTPATAAFKTSSVSSTDTVTTSTNVVSSPKTLPQSPSEVSVDSGSNYVTKDANESTASSPKLPPVISIPDSKSVEKVDAPCQKVETEKEERMDSIPVEGASSEKLEVLGERVTVNNGSIPSGVIKETTVLASSSGEDIIMQQETEPAASATSSPESVNESNVGGSNLLVGEPMDTSVQTTPTEPVTFSVVSPTTQSISSSSSEALVNSSSDVLLASISSEGTVIVRTPTPTPSTETGYNKVSNKNESIVTYTVAGESEEESKSEKVLPETTVPVTSTVSVVSESSSGPVSVLSDVLVTNQEAAASVSIIPESSFAVSPLREGTASVSVFPEGSASVSVSTPETPTVMTVVSEGEVPVSLVGDSMHMEDALSSQSPDKSIGEAEAQAVFILETAINSALDSSRLPSEEEAKGEVVVVSSEETSEQGTGGGDVSGLKLDESEVLITSSSIPEDEEKDKAKLSTVDSSVTPTLDHHPEPSIGREEEEKGRLATVSSPTSINDEKGEALEDRGEDSELGARHHVSVVSVEEKNERGTGDEVKVIGSGEANGTKVGAASEVIVDGPSPSEDATPGVSLLTIEGTTLEDTDVDEVESGSSLATPSTVDINDFVTKKAKSLNEETVINLSNDDEAKTVTTATTPSTGPSTPSTGDPKKPKGAVEGEDEIDEEGGRRRVGSDATPLQPIQNGIRRQNSRASDERSDTDTTSTVGSDKENRHVLRGGGGGEESDASEEVTLRHTNRKSNNNNINTTTSSSSSNFSSGDTAKNIKNKELQASIALRKKTRKRTRKFVIDGVVVTTTTSKVIYGDDEDTGMFSSAHLARKQELRELKLVQKREQKQFQDLALKANIARQEQEKKFDIEKANLLRSYDSQIENLIRQQKQLVEKAEGRQESELKVESKKIRVDQERELKAFKESLKQEWKLLKQEVDLLPKDRRKENFKIRKEQLERDQAEREKACLERLNDSHEMALKRLNDKHRKHIALKERQFLEEKHQLLRSRESALWDMEERHIQDKHQLAKEQLKDIYFLQRLQMTIRHNVELEQVRRFNQQKEEALLKKQQEERRQLPKRIRQEMKTREKMFREQMRISMTQLPSHEQEKEQIKKFQEQEKIKYDKERKRAEMKHKKQMEELTAATEASIKELIHLQNEKGKLLTEHETYKLKSLDEEYQKELREWKSNLAPRKHKLEEDFERQLKEQEKFYGDYLDKSLGLCTPCESTTSLASTSSHHFK